MSQSFDVVIIGGGAAGLMCALTAGQRGRRVLLIEHANRIGKKILMSGGGRCNFTNTGCTPGQFLSANPHFCKSALARFTPADFIAMVDRHRIAWHEKELGQLFCDDSSKQIVQLLVDECAAGGVEILTDCIVDTVEREEAAGASTFSVRTTRGSFAAPALVVASGGLSIPRMGASGFGHGLARQFGHQVLPLRAGLVPLTLTGIHSDHLLDLSGVSLPVSALCNVQSFENAMLITHRGLSGPAILQISSYWEPGDALRIDLLPGQDSLTQLRAAQSVRPAVELKTVLSEWLPKRLAQRLCEVWLPNKPMRQYDIGELRHVAEVLHQFPIVASGTEGYRTAEVTLGGVDTNELSSSTMQSRQVPGLYFIGEVVDVTGWLGGYNFQWAWASGFAAGNAV